MRLDEDGGTTTARNEHLVNLGGNAFADSDATIARAIGRSNALCG